MDNTERMLDLVDMLINQHIIVLFRNLASLRTEGYKINNLDKDVKDIPEEELYKQYFETLKDKFNKEGINATGTFKKLFGDYNSQWIRLSYLKPEDEPNIADNGMYLIFDINFKNHINIL